MIRVKEAGHLSIYQELMRFRLVQHPACAKMAVLQRVAAALVLAAAVRQERTSVVFAHQLFGQSSCNTVNSMVNHDLGLAQKAIENPSITSY